MPASCSCKREGQSFSLACWHARTPSPDSPSPSPLPWQWSSTQAHMPSSPFPLWSCSRHTGTDTLPGLLGRRRVFPGRFILRFSAQGPQINVAPQGRRILSGVHNGAPVLVRGSWCYHNCNGYCVSVHCLNICKYIWVIFAKSRTMWTEVLQLWLVIGKKCIEVSNHTAYFHSPISVEENIFFLIYIITIAMLQEPLMY